MRGRKQVPEGWIFATIADVTCPQVPKRIPSGGGEFNYIDIGSIDRRTKRIIEPKRIPCSAAPSRARQLIAAGDVLVSMTRPNLNAVALVPEYLDGAIASTGFDVLRALCLDPRWIYLLVQTNDFVVAMSSVVQGALYPAVRSQDIRSYPIPVAPVAEQRRIADKVDAAFSRIDAAVSALERVRANLKRYRASVLKAACEGRLVPTEAELARREGRDYEPADVLLKRILKERRARWEAEELARLRAQGKEPKDDRWKRKYKEPQAPDTSGLPELPEGWVWASVNQLGRVHSGQTPIGIQDRCSSEGDVPFFRVGDMNHPENVREMNVADCWLTSDSIGALRLHVRQPGTIIFPKRGGAIATNKKRILSRPSCYDLNTMGITPAHEVAEYFWWWFSSIDLSALGDGSNVPQINHGDIEPLPVPLPPLAEQKRIADEVSKRISISEALNNTIDLAQRRTTRLRQSILKRAFEGRLVPQDPSDEPASVLLERIRAERGSHAGGGKGARGRRATVPVPR